MQRLFVTLAMDLDSKSYPDAGWYIDVVLDTGRLMEPMPISPATAYTLAQDFQQAMQESEHELPQFSLAQLVQSSSGEIHNALKQQLIEAEEQAAKITTLRKKLQGVAQYNPQENKNITKQSTEG